jgi:cystathionine beta-lyase
VKYDFDTLLERSGTNSAKWDKRAELFGSDDVLPLWVADMDFPCPEPVVRAVQERAAHPIYGYGFAPRSLLEAIVERAERHWGWRIKPEWIVLTSGVVNGLYTAIRVFTRPGDEVVVQPPVYYPFYNAVKYTGCQVVSNPLRLADGRYTMDLEGLEEAFRPATTFPPRRVRIKALVLCSPHNPVGRVWSPGELQALGRACLEHDCPLISDEIHCDLLLGGRRHTVTATVLPELEQATVTLMAASKTFNLAGLDTSYAVIPNRRWRQEFIRARLGEPGGNVFGWVALEAAYRHGDEYLEQLLAYLTANVEYFLGYLGEHMPRLKPVRPEGTYLVWVDMRGLGLDARGLQRFMREKARLACDDGFAFGQGGEGFQRFNLACPRSMVEEAVRRLERAVAGV